MAPRKQPAKASIVNFSEERAAEAAKIARLRALRLAKEAEDREAAERNALAAPAKSRRRPRTASAVPRNDLRG